MGKEILTFGNNEIKKKITIVRLLFFWEMKMLKKY